MPLGFRVGYFGLYASMNLAFSDDPYNKNNPKSVSGIEILGGYSFNLYKHRLFLLTGAGVNYTTIEKEVITGYWGGTGGSGYYYGYETEEIMKFAFEVGLMPVVFKHLYLTTAYRLIGFSKSGFSIGVGFLD